MILLQWDCYIWNLISADRSDLRHALPSPVAARKIPSPTHLTLSTCSRPFGHRLSKLCHRNGGEIAQWKMLVNRWLPIIEVRICTLHIPLPWLHDWWQEGEWIITEMGIQLSKHWTWFEMRSTKIRTNRLMAATRLRTEQFTELRGGDPPVVMWMLVYNHSKYEYGW